MSHDVDNHYQQWEDSLKTLSSEPSILGEKLYEFKAFLSEHFSHKDSLDPYIEIYSQAVDQVLKKLFMHFFADDYHDLALIAVGGYGRSAMYPESDIDLLILLPDSIDDQLNDNISQFITSLWDMGLDIGHSVRTCTECVEQALEDLTTITTMIESRLLVGNDTLFATLREKINTNNIWDSEEFFTAKLSERNERHLRFGNNAYRLEPNIKESRGGLRDIHLLSWITKRHYNVTGFKNLVDLHILTTEEYKTLLEGYEFLGKIRFNLHAMLGRKEDRLLLNYQKQLADKMGFVGDSNNETIEAFMQKYYCTVIELSRLCEMAIKLLDEEIVRKNHTLSLKPINSRFQISNGYLEARHNEVFKTHPPALLEVFLIYAQYESHLVGIGAKTIRQIRDHLYLIDDEFRNNLTCRKAFMNLLRVDSGLTHAIRAMNSYGVLALYIPAFDNIVGRMQFDLFHQYTVDEHILMVIRNLRRLGVERFSHEVPECTRLFKDIPKPELLYLAGLFHDIAKGRGGDHSELGSEDARVFCKLHDLSDYETDLVAWLIENHLLMSTVSQRKDISDPDVINDFSAKVKSPLRLRYLYILTTADVRGTNPSLWNNWKASLLSELYHRTLRWMTTDDEQQQTQWINEVKRESKDLLLLEGLDADDISNAWTRLSEDYFQRFSPNEIALHTRVIANHQQAPEELIHVNPKTSRGATQVVLYMHPHPRSFYLIARGLEQLKLNIIDAHIYTTRTGMALDTFDVLETGGKPVDDSFRLDEIQSVLNKLLLKPNAQIKFSSQPTPRHLKLFDTPTEINITDDNSKNISTLDIVTGDRPGLLADIAQIICERGYRIKMAKIATVSEVARDIIYLANKQNMPLNEQEKKLLETSLKDALNQTKSTEAPYSLSI